MKGEVETEIKENGKVTFRSNKLLEYAELDPRGVLIWYWFGDAGEKIEGSPATFEDYMRTDWVAYQEKP